MGCVQPDGGEDGQQFAVEIVFYPFALLGGPGVAAVEEDVFFCQCGQQFFVEDAVLLADDVVRFFGYSGDGFGGRVPGLENLSGIGACFLFQIGHADFKKFVQIGRDDAQKAQAFQKRDTRILRLGEYAPVECQKAHFAAENV
jgi:hypothetical protein